MLGCSGSAGANSEFSDKIKITRHKGSVQWRFFTGPPEISFPDPWQSLATTNRKICWLKSQKTKLEQKSTQNFKDSQTVPCEGFMASLASPFSGLFKLLLCLLFILRNDHVSCFKCCFHALNRTPIKVPLASLHSHSIPIINPALRDIQIYCPKALSSLLEQQQQLPIGVNLSQWLPATLKSSGESPILEYRK